MYHSISQCYQGQFPRHEKSFICLFYSIMKVSCIRFHAARLRIVGGRWALGATEHLYSLVNIMAVSTCCPRIFGLDSDGSSCSNFEDRRAAGRELSTRFSGLVFLYPELSPLASSRRPSTDASSPLYPLLLFFCLTSQPRTVYTSSWSVPTDDHWLQ